MSALRFGRGDISRLLYLLRALGRHGLAYFLSRGAWRRAVLARWRGLSSRLPADLEGPRRSRLLLEEMGGSFVKLGQMLALQGDLVPRAYCRALQDLLDRVPPFPFEEVQRLIREETGRGAEAIFDRLEPRPLATASVAQVHVGWLDGRKVAVKVQRPSAGRELSSDIRLVSLANSLIRLLRLRPLYWLQEPLGEFVAWTREELDFRCEARYTEQLGALARDNPKQAVPRVEEALTSRRLLVIDFLEGTVLLDYLRAVEDADGGRRAARLEPPGFDRARFSRHVIDNFLSDAFEHGIYHADLHPANLLILPGSVVGYIDFGITGVMSRHARRQLASMTLALATGDMTSLHGRFLELAAPDRRADPRAFREGLDRLAAQWYGPGGSRLRVGFTRIMGDMLHLSRSTYLLPERDIVKYIRSSIAIDGLVSRFAPDFDVGGYLAERCAAQLQRQERRERLAAPRLLAWAATGRRLLVEGPDQLRRLAERLDELPDAPQQPAGASTSGRRGLLAASMAAVAALAVAWPPEAPAPGPNLWTAQMLFVAGAALVLGVGAFVPARAEGAR